MMQHNKTRLEQNAPHTNIWLWLGPLIYTAIVGVYFVARFEGRWAESDTAAFTQFIRAILREGQLLPTQGSSYANGYATQMISVWIINLTGLDVAALQQLVYPVLACLVVLPAWLLYRELTGSARGATLASMVLLTQPEFLFVILRSSHEKFTRSLMMLSLFWLVRSFKVRDQPGKFVLHVGLLYITTFGLISSNNLLAHSFIFAVAIALCLGWLLEKRLSNANRRSHLLQRLPYAIMICLGLDYLFTFYAYRPAEHDLQVLKDVWERVAALLLDLQTRATNPYTQVQAGWVSLQVYLLVSIANWLILLMSVFIGWRQIWAWFRRGNAPKTEAERLLLLFYCAFAIQGGFSIVTDASGAFGNLQHRLFSSFSMLAAALVGAALAQWRPQRLALPIRTGIAALIGCVAILSMLKATNEPLLSNFWTFYRQSEVRAMNWSDEHLANAYIWTEFNERLNVAFLTTSDKALTGDYNTPTNNKFVGNTIPGYVRYAVLSDVTRLHSRRLQRPLQIPADAMRVYDNGSAELYHTRPQTPYQP